MQNPLNDATKMTLLWWTNLAATQDDAIRIGPNVAGLGTPITQATPTTCEIGTAGRCHRIDLTGLTANTDYVYELRTNGAVVQAADNAITFHTLVASTDPTATVQFVVLGDYGDGGSEANLVRNLVNSHPGQFILTVGDNAYTEGSLTQWEDNVLKVYAALP